MDGPGGDGPFAPFISSSSTPSPTEVFGGSTTANPDASNGGLGSGSSGEDPTGDSNSDVHTITTTGLMGQEVTYTLTDDGVDFTTKDPLAPDSTATSHASHVLPTYSTRPAEASGPETTYLSTNSLGFPTMVTNSMSIAPFLPSVTQSPSDSMASTNSLPLAPVSTASPEPQSAVPPPPNQNDNSGISHGAIAAAVIVPILAVLALIALAFFFLRRRRTHRRRAREANSLAGPEAPRVPSSFPPPPGPMREPSRDYFTGHSIPASNLADGGAGATVPPPYVERHPLENIRTGPPPTAFNDRNSSIPGSREVSAVFSSSSNPMGASATGDETPYSTSQGSDPFRDPHAPSFLMPEAAASPHDSFSGFSSDPVSPMGPVTTAAPRDSFLGAGPVSPPTRQASRVSRASTREGEEDLGDDVSVISMGEAAVGDVQRGGRASVVHLRKGSESVSSGSPTTARGPGV